jgi:hypothetical protein
MRRFFQSRAIGGPQFAAAALLVVFLLECLWMAGVIAPKTVDIGTEPMVRIYFGLRQWKSSVIAGTPESFRAFETDSTKIVPRFTT